MKNVKTSLGSNYDAIRHIIYDSIMVDEEGQYFQTLKWLIYQKWGDSKSKSPKFDCPHCSNEIPGLPYDVWGMELSVWEASACFGTDFIFDSNFQCGICFHGIETGQ